MDIFVDKSVGLGKNLQLFTVLGYVTSFFCREWIFLKKVTRSCEKFTIFLRRHTISHIFESW